MSVFSVLRERLSPFVCTTCLPSGTHVAHLTYLLSGLSPARSVRVRTCHLHVPSGWVRSDKNGAVFLLREALLTPLRGVGVPFRVSPCSSTWPLMPGTLSPPRDRAAHFTGEGDGVQGAEAASRRTPGPALLPTAGPPVSPRLCGWPVVLYRRTDIP